MSERDEWAWRYFELGWCPLVLCDPAHAHAPPWHAERCGSPGKAPLGRWKHLQGGRRDRRSLKLELLAYPRGNLGLVLGGESGLAMVDTDSKAADEWFRGRFPTDGAPRFATRRGMRYVFRERPGAGAASRVVAPEVELLAGGRQTVAPPSSHASGAEYRWVGGGCPADAESLPWLPEGLAEGSPSPPPAGVFGGGGVSKMRNDRLFRLACALRRHGAEPGEVGECLQVFNRRCRPPLTPGELRTIAGSACRYSPS